MVWQDDMESYTTLEAMGDNAVLGGGPVIVPHPSPVTKSEPVNHSQNEIIQTGRNGTQALRLKYSGVYQASPTFLTLNVTKLTTDQATHYYQYWGRLSAGVSPSAIKWFMAWHRHASNTRVQWNTHDRLPCPVGGRRIYWQVYDQGETTCQGNQPVGPYWEDIADGEWHRFTYMYKPNSASGARDAVARMWIDGVKIIDISIATCGVTPPGGEKTWCEVDDIDALATADGITTHMWGSNQTKGASSPWTYDFDDFRWWVMY